MHTPNVLISDGKPAEKIMHGQAHNGHSYTCMYI